MSDAEKGIPSFWVTAMKTNEVLAEEVSDRIRHHSLPKPSFSSLSLCLVLKWVYYALLPLVQISERDEEALKYLKDIKWYRIDNPKGFKLEFFFDTNPFFKNTVLTKTYHMIDDDEPILEKAIG